MKLDPWSTVVIEDYDKLFKEFGIQEMPKGMFKENHYFRRKILFGHRDFDKFVKAHKNKEPVSILTGLMPSGVMHFGHKMVVDQVVFYQNLGILPRILIADIEARTTRNISKKDAEDNAINEYLLNWVALGLDLKKADVYAQTKRSVPYSTLAATLAGRVTMAEMEAIYGTITPGKLTSALTQAADILHGQLEEYEGKSHVLVPVGVDQDPHMRLARDLAEKLHWIKPASTYHRFMKGLVGEKMSSSKPTSYIGLNEPWPSVKRKISRMETAGRETWEEQKKLGGRAAECPVYEMDAYHFMLEDKELKSIWDRCYGGELKCGDCKGILLDKVEVFFKSHKKSKEKAVDKVQKFSQECFGKV